jgi:hypothetical protein
VRRIGAFGNEHLALGSTSRTPHQLLDGMITPTGVFFTIVHGSVRKSSASAGNPRRGHRYGLHQSDIPSVDYL